MSRLQDFLDQATPDAPSVTKFFTDARVNGHWLQVRISRDLLDTDVRQQLDGNDRPATDRAGNPKFVLVIPVSVLGGSEEFTEDASLPIRGLIKEGFITAMAAAGIEKPSLALMTGRLGGAQLRMTSAGTRAPMRSGYSATKLYDFEYTSTGRELED
jgi:hypothetical protein